MVCPFHRRSACPGPVPVRGCWATSRRAACSAPVRSGEARFPRASATVWAASPTPPPLATSPATPATRTPPASASADHRRSRVTIPGRASPTPRPTSASAGRGGPAAAIDGSRPTVATRAPATGPTTAHAVTPTPCSPASTTKPTTRASTPARLIVAASPASNPVAATERAANLASQPAVQHDQADGRQHGRRRIGVGQGRGGTPQPLGLERPRADPAGDPQPADHGHQQANPDHPDQQDLPILLPEATTDQQHRDHPDQQHRQPDTSGGNAHQGTIKDRPGGQGQRGNDWQQPKVISGQRPPDQPKQGRGGNKQAEGPLYRGVEGALPQQSSGDGDQQEEPGQLGRPTLCHAVGTGVARPAPVTAMPPHS